MGLKYVGVVEVPSAPLRYLVYAGLLLAVVSMTFVGAYAFSTIGVSYYGPMLHGDIPWFNFRATQYMSDNGWHAFFHWFDYMSWYPLGRPVGSTTYPGLQITAVAIHRALNGLGMDISLNNVCVFMPVFCGLAGMGLIGALAYELSGSLASATASIMILCTVPAYAIMSLAGEFTAQGLSTMWMLLTFFLWVRALRCPRSWPIGVLAGLAYGAMAATWVGHLFALNMIALHAVVCGLADFAKNKYNPALLRAYALFYVSGTAIATRVPPVGMAPFKSLEQLSALLVLVLLFGLWVADVMCTGCAGHLSSGSSMETTSKTEKHQRIGTHASRAPETSDGPGPSRPEERNDAHAKDGQREGKEEVPDVTADPALQVGPRRLRVSMCACAVMALFGMVQVGVGAGLIDSPSPRLRAIMPGFLGGRSFSASADAAGRVRSPLHVLRDRDFSGEMESVWSAVLTPYFLWLTYMMVSMTQLTSRLETPTQVFAPLLCAASLFVGMRVRDSAPLIVVGASLASGLAAGWAYDLAVLAALWDPDVLPAEVTKMTEERAAYEAALAALPARERISWESITRRLTLDMRTLKVENPLPALISFSCPLVIILLSFMMTGFRSGAASMVIPYVHPGLSFHVVEGGDMVRVDDYLDGYTWLHAHTPADARVLAWHPHGYHINLLSNRTTLVDSSTAQAEQIALVAKIFTAPQAEAHALVRHLADYVLIWAGKEGLLDIYQLPFMALMANALFGDVCSGDPLCRFFSFSDEEMTRARPMLKQSLLYALHQHRIDKRKPIIVDDALFDEVYTSPRGIVRIFKVVNVSEDSKAWMADPAHRECQPEPDQWICPGKYPPAEPLQALWRLAQGGFDRVDEGDIPPMHPTYPNVDEMPV